MNGWGSRVPPRWYLLAELGGGVSGPEGAHHHARLEAAGRPVTVNSPAGTSADESGVVIRALSFWVPTTN